MENSRDHIESNPDAMLGKSVVKGTRGTIELLLRKLADGYKFEFIIICLCTFFSCHSAHQGNLLNSSFEETDSGTIKRWFIPESPYQVALDSSVTADGYYSLKMQIDTKGKAPYYYGIFMNAIPIVFAADSVTISGKIRTENVKDGYAGVFCNIDTEDGRMISESMEEQGVTGSTEWSEYQLKLKMPEKAQLLTFGGLLTGTGEAWFDDFVVYIDQQEYKLAALEYRKTLDEEEIAWVREHAVILNINQNVELFEASQSLQDRKIVALGEATHGTGETTKMKHKLIEYLVSDLKFSVLAIEANMPEVKSLNDFVLYGEGEPKSLIKGLGFWMYRTEAFLELIKWMRTYNESKEDRYKVKLMGFDMQKLEMSFEKIKQFGAATAHSGLAEKIVKMEALIKAYNKELKQPYLLADSTMTLFKNLASSIHEDMQRDSAIYSNSVERDDLEWLLQYTRLTAQYFDNLSQIKENGIGIRDSLMYENIRWIEKQYPGEKIMVWAHNEHIRKHRKQLGGYLQKHYSDRFFAIGFLLNSGAYAAMKNGRLSLENQLLDSEPGSIEYCLNQVGLSAFFLKVNNPAHSANANWLNARLTYRSIGAVATGIQFYPINISTNFDGIIYIDETNPITPF